ncbi:hypothetical protein ACIRBX_03110 [Kitasatospora sp. NPDC096147]|uniref:hypothetical protein n=1 Tax=Kitasatospora sp. NPDC096147 TaxID=3364093 RepID=UPI0037FBEEB4
MPYTRPVEAVRLPRRRRSGCAPATPFEHELTELAARRATGVLSGEHGRVHLAQGAVVYAESHSAPGVEALLTGCGRIASAEWASLLGSCSATGRPLAELLLRTGLVTRSELQLCLTTAVLDAAFFALGPAGRRPVFIPSAAPLFALTRPLTVRELRAAVGRRRALLDRVWPAPQGEHGPVLRRRTGGGPVRGCTLRRRAVLEAADGLRTPSEIALLLGRSAFTTLLDLRHLAAGGLLEAPATTPVPLPATGLTPAVTPVIPVIPTVPAAPPAPPRPATPPPGTPRPAAPTASPSRPVPSVPPPRSAPPAPTPPVPVVPVITSLPTATAPGRTPVTQPTPAYDPSDPHVALLLRIRAGLEARL